MTTREATLPELPLELLVKILLLLSEDERDAKPAFAKHHRSMAALMCSFKAAAEAAQTLTHQQLLSTYFWAHHPNVVKLFKHPHWVKNFFAINSRLNAINSFIKQNTVSEMDLFCLSGQMDLIEAVIERRARFSFNVSQMRRYCFLAAVSENPLALKRLCDDFRFNVHVLAPLPVQQAAHITQHTYLPTMAKNSSVLQLVLLHGTAGALQCMMTMVPSERISEFMLRHGMVTHIANQLVNERMHYVNHDHRYLSLVLSFCHTPEFRPALQVLQHTLLMNLHIKLYKLVQRHFIAHAFIPSIEALIQVLKVDDLQLFKDYLDNQPQLKRKIMTNQGRYGYQLFYDALKERVMPAIISYFLEELELLSVCSEQQLRAIMRRAAVMDAANLQLLLKYPQMANFFASEQDALIAKLLSSPHVSKCETIIVLLEHGIPPTYFLLKNTHNVLLELGRDSFYWKMVAKMLEKGLKLSILIPDEEMTIGEMMFYVGDKIPEYLLLIFIREGMNKSNHLIADVLDNCLQAACTNGKYHCIDLLIEAGASITQTYRFVVACGRALLAEAHLPAFNDFFAEYGANGRVAGCTVLDLAIASYNYDAVKAIVAHIERGLLRQLIVTKRLYNFWIDEHVPQFTTMDLAVGLGDERIIALLCQVLDLELQASPQPIMM